ncbi:hypothetical protein HBA54_19830 [Pelagibius litoralis]|uniref:VOC domain-containing protein n=1 Tax=Pelagibius litoralis TaxID=374515 RepID=A0A967F0N8_9PROT|nr:VOC family protein [Pelagibius litoralis]NIA70853.1 hypothetical protein [Pelagibius litoralis]
MVDRLLTNIMVTDLQTSRDFYTALLDLKVHFDSDWYVILTDRAAQSFELGLIGRDDDLIPAEQRGSPAGLYLTFVVADADAIYQRALTQDCRIVKAPHDTFYGQRRFLALDPDGLMIDVSAPTAPPPSEA